MDTQLSLLDYDRKILPVQEQAHSEWLDIARGAARYLSAQRGEITIDDVREVCPPPPEIDPRIMGAVFKPKSDWECTGYRKSDREECNGRPVGLWRLK